MVSSPFIRPTPNATQTRDTCMNLTDLYERNLAYLEDELPDVARIVKGANETLSTLVRENGIPIDIDLGQDRFYKVPVQDFVRDQIDAFFADPGGFEVTSPSTAYLKSAPSLRVRQRLLDSLASRNLEPTEKICQGTSECLFVLGLGLGLHVEPLLERTNPEHILIIEPIAEFVRHSMEVVDWAGLLERCRERDIGVHFILADDPETIVSRCLGPVKSHGAHILDGSLTYLHYPSQATVAARDKIMENIPYQFMSIGFFEDERLMVVNSAENLVSHPFRLVEGTPRSPRPETAFIVASGPSIDGTIEALTLWKDRAVIISSGSALQILLQHGIVPDYHVELENVPQVVQLFHYILDKFPDRFPERRFAGLKLIASVTIDPVVPPLFDETYFFFRDTVSSTYGFGAEHAILYLVGPNVSNTSTAVAAALGFKKQVFFGTDCGMRDAARHHSKDTIYYTHSKTFSSISGGIEAESADQFQIPGNFGGKVQTDSILNWSRQMLETAIQAYGLEVQNCSDGGLIVGATPKAAEGLIFTETPLDKDAILTDIREQSAPYEAGRFFDDHDLGRYVDDSEAMLREFKDVMSTSTQEDHAFGPFFRRLKAFLTQTQDDYPCISRIIYGSAAAIPLIASYYLKRIENSTVREEIFEEFRAEFSRIVEDMLHETSIVFREIAARKGARPAPER